MCAIIDSFSERRERGTDDVDVTLLEARYWWGVPTFFRCPYDPDPATCDIAVTGVPHSSGNVAFELVTLIANRIAAPLDRGSRPVRSRP